MNTVPLMCMDLVLAPKNLMYPAYKIHVDMSYIHRDISYVHQRYEAS